MKIQDTVLLIITQLLAWFTVIYASILKQWYIAMLGAASIMLVCLLFNKIFKDNK